jgi:hypothetical protein
MPIIARASSNSYIPAPAGTHAAVCCDVVDLGVVEVKWGAEAKRQHKIDIVWQIDELRNDNKPYTVKKRYTLSLHEKAGLRKDLESWRGRPFTSAELEGFDVETILNVPCMLNIIHNVKDGSTYANVAAVMRMPKGMPSPSVRDYVRVCDRQPAQGEEVPPDFGDAPITDDDVPF